jgi:hypothetical protein
LNSIIEFKAGERIKYIFTEANTPRSRMIPCPRYVDLKNGSC